MAEVFLDVALVDFGGAGETGAQRMAGEQRQAVFLRQVRPDAGVEHGALDQARDVFVVEACLQRLLAVPRGADKDWAKVDLGEVQPLFERMDRAGLILGAAIQASIKATGTIVAFVFFAKWNGPFLNGPIVPVIVRVPSGAINNEMPFLITDSASSRL